MSNTDWHRMAENTDIKKKRIPKVPGLDRRMRLSSEDRADIIKAEGISVRQLAKMYGVSRRTIQFIRNPELRDQMMLRREERGGWRAHHDPEKHKASMADTRRWRKQLELAGKLEEPDA